MKKLIKKEEVLQLIEDYNTAYVLGIKEWFTPLTDTQQARCKNANENVEKFAKMVDTDINKQADFLNDLEKNLTYVSCKEMLKNYNIEIALF